MAQPLWVWVGFNLCVLAILAIDLGVFHRKAHEVSVREAAGWTVTWISLSLLFNFGIYRFMGAKAGLEFLTGYLIEQALSVDNIFVFVLIFTYFEVPKRFQHRILFWGILGALLLRGTMIGMGAFLIHRFEWILYVFGAFLVYTGIRMAMVEEQGTRRGGQSGDQVHAPDSAGHQPLPRAEVLRARSRRDRRGEELVATPLFVVLVMVETTDVIFAVDSIPAIFAVTTDPFLVYTSNVCAILGLRSLYFLLAGIVDKFRFLQLGLSMVLVFVGGKMLIADFFKVPVGISLGIVAGILITSITASLLFPKEAQAHPPLPVEPSIGGSGPETAPIEPDPDIHEVHGDSIRPRARVVAGNVP